MRFVGNFKECKKNCLIIIIIKVIKCFVDVLINLCSKTNILCKSGV